MQRWLIIDGYNLIHRAGATEGPGWLPRDLMGRRRLLIQMLETVAGVLADRITVVFDGRTRTLPPEAGSAAVEVVFSPGHKTADTVIEQMVFGASRPGAITVVTSDRRERETAEAAGAETMACSVFFDMLKEAQDAIERNLRARAAKAAPPSLLGDVFARLDGKKKPGTA